MLGAGPHRLWRLCIAVVVYPTRSLPTNCHRPAVIKCVRLHKSISWYVVNNNLITKPAAKLTISYKRHIRSPQIKRLTFRQLSKGCTCRIDPSNAHTISGSCQAHRKSRPFADNKGRRSLQRRRQANIEPCEALSERLCPCRNSCSEPTGSSCDIRRSAKIARGCLANMHCERDSLGHSTKQMCRTATLSDWLQRGYAIYQQILVAGLHSGFSPRAPEQSSGVIIFQAD